MEDRLLFVIGAPRSGSTMLQRMLGAHSAIYSCPEPHIITPLAHLGYYHTVDKAPYDHLRGVDAIRQFVEQLPRKEADYLDACRAYTDTLYSRRLQQSGKRFFLDKTPAYALVLDFLARLYPRARYVVLTRHPAAIFCSFANSFFDGDYSAAVEFNPVLSRYVPPIARFIQSAPVPLVHVRYEDLVTHPSEEMGRVLDFLDLPFERGVVEYGSSAQKEKGLGDPVSVARHSRPMTKSVEKWVHELLSRPEKYECVRRQIDLLDPDELALWGFPYSEIYKPLEDFPGEVRPPKKPRLDLFQVQRKILLRLRRNIHHNALGKAVQKIRFCCDVLLR